MRVTPGRIVIVSGLYSNGLDEHPAIVTRVWSDHDTKDGAVFVNLTVFLDSAPPVTYTSIALCETREAASQAGYGLAAFWPERVA